MVVPPGEPYKQQAVYQRMMCEKTAIYFSCRRSDVDGGGGRLSSTRFPPLAEISTSPGLFCPGSVGSASSHASRSAVELNVAAGRILAET